MAKAALSTAESLAKDEAAKFKEAQGRRVLLKGEFPSQAVFCSGEP